MKIKTQICGLILVFFISSCSHEETNNYSFDIKLNDFFINEESVLQVNIHDNDAATLNIRESNNNHTLYDNNSNLVESESINLKKGSNLFKVKVKENVDTLTFMFQLKSSENEFTQIIGKKVLSKDILLPIIYNLRYDNNERFTVRNGPSTAKYNEEIEIIIRAPYQRKNAWIECDNGEILSQTFIPYKYDEPLNDGGIIQSHIKAQVRCKGNMEIRAYSSK